MSSSDPVARALADHAERNARLLAQLHDLGVDPDDPVAIDCFFLCRNESRIASLMERLDRAGFMHSRRAGEPSPDTSWTVHGVLLTSPRGMADERITERLIRIAFEHDASYDGWSTAVVG